LDVLARSRPVLAAHREATAALLPGWFANCRPSSEKADGVHRGREGRARARPLAERVPGMFRSIKGSRRAFALGVPGRENSNAPRRPRAGSGVADGFGSGVERTFADSLAPATEISRRLVPRSSAQRKRSWPEARLSLRVESAGLILRIGRRPDQQRPPDWSLAGADGTFGNRFDDPDGTYRVLYASSQRFGGFLETLACFRLDLTLSYPMRSCSLYRAGIDVVDSERHAIGRQLPAEHANPFTAIQVGVAA